MRTNEHAPAPELGCEVAAAAGQHVANGVPLHVPNRRVVHHWQLHLRLLMPHQPVIDRAIVAPRGEQALVQRVPGTGRNVLCVAAE